MVDVIDRSEARRNVVIMAKRLGRLYYWFIKHAIDELGEERAEKFAKDVIKSYGDEIGISAREAVLAAGLEPNIGNYSKGGDLPTEGWDKKVLVHEENHVESKTTYCPIAEALMKDSGFEKWARIYCDVDAAKYATYDEQACCVCKENIIDGDECCHLVITKK